MCAFWASTHDTAVSKKHSRLALAHAMVELHTIYTESECNRIFVTQSNETFCGQIIKSTEQLCVAGQGRQSLQHSKINLTFESFLLMVTLFVLDTHPKVAADEKNGENRAKKNPVALQWPRR